MRASTGCIKSTFSQLVPLVGLGARLISANFGRCAYTGGRKVDFQRFRTAIDIGDRDGVAFPARLSVLGVAVFQR